MANPPPTRTTILPRGDTSLTAFFINKPFDISFDISSSFSAVVRPTYQLCNSYTGLAPYLLGSNFKGAFPSTGFKQYLQVDALVPTGTTLVSTYRSRPLPLGRSASYPAWDSNGRMYFSDDTTAIYRMTVDNSYELFAGSTIFSGYDDGDRLTQATFTTPRSIVFDSNGDMLIAMQVNIRKINMTTGQVTTLAGPSFNEATFADGTGSAARFNGALVIRAEPGGTGNFMIGDYDNNCIRKMTPTGDVTTVIGSNSSGYEDGFGTAARFTKVADFAYGSDGTMYIVDQFNYRIRSVSPFPFYEVTTYAGSGLARTVDGPLLDAAFGTPSSIETDASDNLYISEFNGSVIRRIVGSNVTTWAGAVGVIAYQDGPLSNARFQYPQNMRRYGDTLYLTDSATPFRMRAITTVSSNSNFPLVNRPAGFSVLDSCSYPITVNSRITTAWTSVGGVLPLFKFEPFFNTITANRCGGITNDILTYTGGLTSTELLGYMAGNGTSNVTFNGPNGASTAYPYSLTLGVRALSNIASVLTVVEDLSTTVTIGTARIVYSPCNANLVFYRNEPSSAPVFRLVASDVSLIYSGTTLPAGLAFTRVDAQSFALTGTPTIQSIASNYTILAFDTASRTYTTQVSMVVNPERLIIDSEGSLTQSNIGFEAPIETITFTSRFPPYGLQRSMRYTWSPQPPAGIQFRDSNGTAIPGSNYTVTASNGFTLTLSGTITEEQLRAFALQGCNAYTITLTGTRTAPTPALSPSLPKTITFRFGETIFFTSNVPPLFVGLDVSGYSYTAKTYFPRVDSSIQGIAVTDGFLPDGIDASFTFATQSFGFGGRPTAAGSYSFTLTASNQSGVSASLPVTTTVLNDSVTVTSLTDACFNFIQYRSLSNGKAGFYTPPMRYRVTSTSGCNVTLTGANLPAGVTLDASGTNTYVLAGRPTAASGLTTATLTGTVGATGVSSTKTFQYSVSAEQFFFPNVSFAFIQNVPITPVVLDVSTLSENSVIRFSAPAIPSALQVTNTGLVQGTLLGSNAGTFDVAAYTAYTSGTKTYSYSVTPDEVLLVPSAYTTVTAPGRSVSIPIDGYSLSATTVSNYQFQSAFPYGLTINSTTGLLSGTLASSLPSSTTFTLVGSAGFVDGSLEGTMVTNNLSVSRASVLEIQSQSNLRLYFSDDSGVNWSSALSSNNTVAGRIGVNTTGTYLVPTSSDSVLRSTTGSSYSAIALGQSSKTPLMTAVVNKPGTSTWWIAGTLSNVSRDVYVFKSTDDGLTWDSGTLVSGVQDRSSNATPGAGVYDAYLYGGVDLAYRDGVLLLGGLQIARSTDDGATWSIRPSSLIEVARFSLDQGTVWLAVGTSRYPSRMYTLPTIPAITIVYSLDQGLTWTPSSNGFRMNAYEVVYGNGVWLATGVDHFTFGTDHKGYVAYSLDGLTWTELAEIPSILYGPNYLDISPLGSFGAIGHDGTTWNVLRTPNDGTATLYSHPNNTPIDSGWTTTTVTSEFSGIGSASRFASYVTQTVDPGADITTITFPTPTTGPTFVSPAQSTYVLWQYMPIPPITFSAPGATAYFVSALPVGLTWNSLTQTITGACMRLGTQTFTVYAKNSGVTAFTVTLIVNVPRIIKQQGGAGAYTSLLRDYTEVNAAINARDTRVNPVEEAALGSFASPYAPDVVTPSNCPC